MILDSQFPGCVRRLAIIWLIVGTTINADPLNGPPKTRPDNVRETLHGIEIVDPYRWLEDQENSETRAWIDAQNQFTDSLLANLPGRDQLRQRLSELLKIESIGIPIERNGRYFFSRRLAEQDLPAIYMRIGLKGEDEVLIDPHALSPDHRTSVSLLDASEDGEVMTYSLRKGGEDEVEVHFMNVESRKDLPDSLPRARYFGTALTRDRNGVYYCRHGKEGSRVFYHAMGQDPKTDVQIFGKGYGPDKGIGVRLSEDQRYLLLTVFHGSAADRTEIYVQDVEKRGPVQTIVNDVQAKFIVNAAGDQLYVQTNWNAPNSKIMRVDLKAPGRDRWREVVPESDSSLESFSLAGGKICANYLKNVQPSIKVFSADGKFERDVLMPSLGTVSEVSGRWRSPETFFVFSSFHVAPTIYRYDVSRGTQEEWARPRVPVQSAQFEIRQVWYASKDGTQIPMFVFHKKGAKLDGARPTRLTGYGGFRQSLTPTFDQGAILWAEQGGVYAVANLRGGNEFGDKWHQAGMLDKKQNVFDDFISAAEWLISNGYTQPAKLAISGASNGGLLVGAALTQRPELFQAVICSYPLLDMVRYHKFLVAKFWVPEYGSADDAEQFKYIRAYSPYHQVKVGTKYPAVLLVSGDADTRVAPLHVRKMAALLQASTGSDRPILLHYDTKAGHIREATPIGKRLDDLTNELSFLFWQLGVM